MRQVGHGKKGESSKGREGANPDVTWISDGGSW